MHGLVTNPETGAAVAAGYEYSLILLLATVSILLMGGGPLSPRLQNESPKPYG